MERKYISRMKPPRMENETRRKRVERGLLKTPTSSTHLKPDFQHAGGLSRSRKTQPSSVHLYMKTRTITTRTKSPAFPFSFPFKERSSRFAMPFQTSPVASAPRSDRGFAAPESLANRPRTRPTRGLQRRSWRRAGPGPKSLSWPRRLPLAWAQRE